MACTKCSGLVVKITHDELKCLICGKRYFTDLTEVYVDHERPLYSDDGAAIVGHYKPIPNTQWRMRRRAITGLLLGLLMILASSLAQADSTAVLGWDANTESDLAGYKIYQGISPGVYGEPVATLGTVTTHTLTYPDSPTAITRYYVLKAYDRSGHESPPSNEVSKVFQAVVVARPETPVLTVSAMSETSLLVTYPLVPDGLGGTANVDIRYGPATAGWGSMSSVFPCASPCVIRGLTPNTSYIVQAVAFRGVMNTGNVFGPLSMVVPFTTPPSPVQPPKGLTVVSATPNKIVVAADVSVCKFVLTSRVGSTPTTHLRTLTCS
jgi:hypothetical protein